MENNILNFELSPNQVKIREILNKQFMELEVWAISTIYPNRNKSHFTLESLVQAVPDVKNTPIVGFFENNDFTTHEGTLDWDPVYRKTFWNTEKGERILGWVRESDPVEIVEKDGVHWLKFRCMLCTRYCYRQVKKLLKDKKKRVSVEIIVKSHEFVDDIEIIHSFELNGVAILGSKNGKAVLEGIPGAHLSVLEGLDGEAMEEQKKVVNFAYNQLDGCEGDNKNTIVEFSNLDENTEKEVKQADMDNIKVDKSAEAMSDKPWGEVDKTALRNKVVEAANFKSIAGDIFLDLREGWEDGETSKLKYPVMELKENTAVYNRGGLGAAKAYASQHGDKGVLEKLEKIYEHLGLEETEEEAAEYCKMCDDCKEDYACEQSCENHSDNSDDKHPEGCDCPECKAARENQSAQENQNAQENQKAQENQNAQENQSAQDNQSAQENQSKAPVVNEGDSDLAMRQNSNQSDSSTDNQCNNNCSNNDGSNDSSDDAGQSFSNSGSGSEHDYAKELEELRAQYSALEESIKEKDEAIVKYEAQIQDYEAKIQNYADYDDVKKRLETAEQKLYAIHCSELKASAVELMRNETIKEEYYNDILSKCENGTYSCDEEIKKDIAIAIYSSRPAQRKEFSMSIPTIMPQTDKSDKTKPKTSADRIKAYLNK